MRFASSLTPLALVVAAPLAGCFAPITPGFLPAAVPEAGPALVATATLGAPGQATVHVSGRDLGALFGVSFHFAVDGAALEDGRAEALLTGALDRTLARVGDGDAAFGGTRLDPADGDVALADGVLASVDVTAVDEGDVTVRIEDAVLRRADGAFVPVAVAGGVLTLEASR